MAIAVTAGERAGRDVFGRAAGARVGEVIPERHGTTLATLTCPVCGAGPFVECDFTAHQEYANSRYPCTACGAAPGEVCRHDCRAADTLAKILAGVVPDHTEPSPAFW